jgi:predicted transcriptional regulator
MVNRKRRLALSIRQPYAEQILRGEKTVEYRSRPTRIRDRVYIYASLRPAVTSDFEALGLLPGSLPAGYVVGSVAIVGCRRRGATYHWLLAEPRRLARPRRPRQQPQPVWFHPW